MWLSNMVRDMSVSLLTSAATHIRFSTYPYIYIYIYIYIYEGWNFDSGNYLFATDTK